LGRRYSRADLAGSRVAARTDSRKGSCKRDKTEYPANRVTASRWGGLASDRSP
jgi:hypothetical protein